MLVVCNYMLFGTAFGDLSPLLPSIPGCEADVPSPAQRQGSKKPDNTEEVSPPITPDAAIAGVSNAEGKDLADPPVVPNIELEDSRTSPEANSYAKSAWLGTLQV